MPTDYPTIAVEPAKTPVRYILGDLGVERDACCQVDSLGRNVIARVADPVDKGGCRCPNMVGQVVKPEVTARLDWCDGVVGEDRR